MGSNNNEVAMSVTYFQMPLRNRQTTLYLCEICSDYILRHIRFKAKVVKK